MSKLKSACLSAMATGVLVAGAIGLFVVVLFMILYYRYPGMLASIALICYSLMVLAIFKLIPVTVTLVVSPGCVISW